MEFPHTLDHNETSVSQHALGVICARCLDDLNGVASAWTLRQSSNHTDDDAARTRGRADLQVIANNLLSDRKSVV